jgi:hypothetical protein
MMPPAALAVVRAAREDARRAGHSSRTAARHALAELAADGWEIRVVEPLHELFAACYVRPDGQMNVRPNTVLSGGTVATVAERIAARTVTGPISLRRGAPGPCLLWTGATTPDGYGRIWADGRARRVHRVAWEAEHGPIPAGLDLDHRCGVRACCNPDHTEPVDHRTNILRSANHVAALAAKTHCCRGHELAGDNLRIRPNGTRQCIPCTRIRAARAANPERTAA